METITAQDRLSLLIDELCNGRQITFAEKTGISRGMISLIMNGKERLTDIHIGKICAAFPLVNMDWLKNGYGNPGDISVPFVRARLDEELRKKEEEIKFLKEQLDLSQRMLEKLLK